MRALFFGLAGLGLLAFAASRQDGVAASPSSGPDDLPPPDEAFDADLTPKQREVVRLTLATTNDPAPLNDLAAACDQRNRPKTAALFRARAAFLAAHPDADPIDKGMPSDLGVELQTILANGTADQNRAAAVSYSANGYPIAAGLLRHHAAWLDKNP